AARTAPGITWRVENPFRFLQDPADTEVHRQTLLALRPEDRRTPVLASERALAARHPEGWAATMYQKVCWNAEDNRHACADDRDYVNVKSHKVLAKVDGIEDAASVDCVWNTAPRGRSPLRGQSITVPCDQTAAL